VKTRIGVLPSLVTLGNLICGFAAIGAAVQAQLHWQTAAEPAKGFQSFALAGFLILAAMVFDALDGKIARMANLTSEFGAQLDSLCDMVSFGVAPAYLVFLEVTSRDLFRNPRYTWVCVMLYVICASLRLARFNVETAPDEESHLYFRGLPSPAAAGVIACLAILDWRERGGPAASSETALWAARVMPFAAIVLGGLMISRIKYLHLLNVLFRERKPFRYLVVLIFGISMLLAIKHFEWLLLLGFGGYMFSGPVLLVSAWPRRKLATLLHTPDDDSAPDDEEDSAIF
jgi:CDP-diacylglycerol--serine O-phosphatidyltransferase